MASFLLIEEMVVSMLHRQVHRSWLKACCLHDEDGFADDPSALLLHLGNYSDPSRLFINITGVLPCCIQKVRQHFSSQTYFIGWVSCFGKNRLKSLSNSTFAGSIIALSNRAAAMVEVVKTNSVTAIKIRRD